MSGRAKGRFMQRRLSRRMAEQLEAIRAMPDSEIDCSDIPEVSDWSGATRGKFYRGPRP